LSDLIANKRERPADDLLTALAGVFRRWRSAVRRRAVGTAYLLILAGYETTVNFIGNGILALLRNPAQLASLRAEPSGLSCAVEEFLRFESPLNIATTRVTTVPVRIGEVEVPADEFVMIALVAANRDLHQFDEPDRLNIARNPNAHLAFGHGIHYCLGAPLARLEGEIALGRLLARFESITLDDTARLQYRNSTLMRGLQALPVRLG
jgi:cytochrome P450